MDFNFQFAALYTAIILTGLSAGLFFAWQVSVIPGTKRVTDTVYIETMQKINRAIINPPFMLIFLGPVVIQLLCAYLYRDAATAFWLILSSVLIYGAGTVIVTGTGNVPLNDALDTVELSKLSDKEISAKRHEYEKPWNRLHLIRTAFAVISFMLLLFTAFIHS
ncbi:DUF1772 domain-containing protein [Rhodohalobacter mucosus]|uniref:DUF1772 domain-containing protein n=1 Tax=Rhodohalobacter mucosus TaxID=2079485 RepID=A0A316TU93_9BACT|nr:DUF1772 domain-containing protein [Rhodohalobacter mucosus]PWN07388.1 DUF1772 domain-containing protein [Rhodohalobacter mucosus]